MINRKTELLVILQEEAAEVIQAISKQFRFGDTERNAKELQTEIADFFGVFKLLIEEGHLQIDPLELELQAEAKINKLDKYMTNKREV
jgi:NTP pyrophosphatase (non-canonical NTP hydrolase)